MTDEIREYAVDIAAEYELDWHTAVACAWELLNGNFPPVMYDIEYY